MKSIGTGPLRPTLCSIIHSRLDAAIAGTDPWLNKQFEQDEDMKKEVQDRSVVAEVSFQSLRLRLYWTTEGIDREKNQRIVRH
jgi:hypothetical protein